MKSSICLIAAPVSTDYEDPADAFSPTARAAARAPKLGVLALAGALRAVGVPLSLLDLDEGYSDYLNGPCTGLDHFPDWIAPRLLDSGASVFGFSSLCSSYPITIRIAQALKRAAPRCTILFGGPQASVVDTATLAAFPFIDFILRGEADQSLPLFMDQWHGARDFASVGGLTWRSAFGVQRNPDAPLIDDLDSLPLPAYDLFPRFGDADYAFLELGRGCPFSCTFCSTNDFFRRRFRLKSPGHLIGEMRLIRQTYGLTAFNLVHDMFTVDRRRVVAFCEAMIVENSSGEGAFNWSCSARTDCVDADLLRLLKAAGCVAMFYGVETGSKRMQRIIDKDLDPVQSRAAVEIALNLGIEMTVSTIVGFPEETEDDLRETLDVFLHALNHPDSIPQLNVLAPLAGTPIQQQYKEQLTLEGVGSGLAYPGRSICGSDRELILRYPEIFPNFYLLPVPSLDRAFLLELAEVMLMAHMQLRWLFVALHQAAPDFVGLLRAWRFHRLKIHGEFDGGQIRHYYYSGAARPEFAAWARSATADFAGPLLADLLDYEEGLAQARPADRPAGSTARGLTAGAVPVRARGVRALCLDFDMTEIIHHLRQRTAATRLSRRGCWYRTEEDATEIRLVEIDPMVGKALLFCDGTRTVQDFLGNGDLLSAFPKNERDYGGRCLLKSLRSEGLIEVVSPTRARHLFSASATFCSI